MKLPVNGTKPHNGKLLELDHERETIKLLGVGGEQMGTVAWGSVIDLILGIRAQNQPEALRTELMDSLVVNVRYRTPDGQWFESRPSGVGDEGLFIESNDPLPVGTKLMMEFAFSDCPSEWLGAKGTVAWVCPNADQYRFPPGMGVRFTEISEERRARLVDLVKSLNQARQRVESPSQAVGGRESGCSDGSASPYSLPPWHGQPTARTA
jgi:uncharacterized protein (TIGR02266 family)